MTSSQQYSALIAVLRGSLIDLGICCFFMLGSIVLFAIGVIRMTDDNVERIFCVQPIVFLVATSFSVTTVWRDRSMRQNYMVLIDKPTLFYTGQSVAFFVFSLGCTVFNFATIAEWKGFYLTAAVWVGISTLSLSKICRDWHYADIFRGLPPEDHDECFAKVSHLCKGTVGHRIYIWSSALLACFLLIGVPWLWDDESVDPQTKSFISVCALWAEGSSFHFCKFIRDFRELLSLRTVCLKEGMPFQVLIVFSCLIAHVAMFLALATHKTEGWQRYHLVAAWGFAHTAVFVVARHVKDRYDILRIIESPEAAQQKDVAYGNPGKIATMQFPMGALGSYAMNAAGPTQSPMGGQNQQYAPQYPPNANQVNNPRIQAQYEQGRQAHMPPMQNRQRDTHQQHEGKQHAISWNDQDDYYDDSYVVSMSTMRA